MESHITQTLRVNKRFQIPHKDGAVETASREKFNDLFTHILGCTFTRSDRIASMQKSAEIPKQKPQAKTLAPTGERGRGL